MPKSRPVSLVHLYAVVDRDQRLKRVTLCLARRAVTRTDGQYLRVSRFPVSRHEGDLQVRRLKAVLRIGEIQPIDHYVTAEGLDYVVKQAAVPAN